MPSKEIKELRLSGKLDEAYNMAKIELNAEPENIWLKRNISWVLYSQLDNLATNPEAFISKINEVKELGLPVEEEMFFDNISIVISKCFRFINSKSEIDTYSLFSLFDAIKDLPLKRKSKWFSVLFSAMHKGMKETNRYIEFADWWDFDNFLPSDFEKEIIPNGKTVISIVERAYIAYAKQLLPKYTSEGDIQFNRQDVEAFLPVLTQVAEENTSFQYPNYFIAKLLLALGNKENALESLLPFAKKKQNDFWVWEILAETLKDDPDKVFACYCKALSCNSPEEMLIGLRQKMAKILLIQKRFNESRTEIDLLVSSRKANGHPIPNEVVKWKETEWYKNAIPFKNNDDLYKSFSPNAELILHNDIPEEIVLVEFVNSDKKMLNFIESETKFGYFKYDRFLKEVNIGDVLAVRFKVGGTLAGNHQIYSVRNINDNKFTDTFIKDIYGEVKIKGTTFGFINDVFINPSIVSKLKLTDGMPISGKAIKSYNREKKQWGWKFIN